ncbi:uncharacterized protein K441DRAFT_585355, partial [Cenococcum geophilum 1.58]|uniref:uncharacterized protein n=1 Tax=Cenococcum geophilum 1.58 TaxID=794803 RepID=UPI003590283D
SLVTTLPAPTTHPLPSVTPGNITTFPPIQQSSPIWISLPSSGPCVPLRSAGSRGCVPEKKETFGPTSVREPMEMRQVSKKTALKFRKTLSPRRILVP